MVYDTANLLAKELRESPEYAAYAKAKEIAMADGTTKSLIDEYHKLQIRAQAATVSGGSSAELMGQLQKLGEVLQFNRQASEFLLAEYSMNKMLADVYKILANAIDIDLSALEA